MIILQWHKLNIYFILFIRHYLIPLQRGRHTPMPREERRRKDRWEERRRRKEQWIDGKTSYPNLANWCIHKRWRIVGKRTKKKETWGSPPIQLPWTILSPLMTHRDKVVSLFFYPPGQRGMEYDSYSHVLVMFQIRLQQKERES